MSKFDHWMRFNIGDYLADTMDLSTYQHGIYILLIMHYFRRGGLPAPDDKAALARIAKTPMRQWLSQSDPVMQLFQVIDGRFKHKRIDAEIQHSRDIAEAKKHGATEMHRRRREAAENSHSFDANARGNGADAGVTRPGARATPETDSVHPPRGPPKNGGAERGRSSKRLPGFVGMVVDISERRRQ